MARIRQILTALGDLKTRIKEGYKVMPTNKKQKIYDDIMKIMGEL